ncbi:MAG: TlpA family protein disulfide reductase [Bacteroidaceae bacterium]|nr:TlpA family protein disulfide reductase [Bacteroidaceae bacterium]
MKRILFLFALLQAVSAQAQEPAKAQQMKNIVNPQDTVLKKTEVRKFVVRRDRSKDDEKNAAMKAFVGQRFTDLEMLDTDGNSHKLSEYVGNGHWLFVDMWASWCGPCRAEMPHVVAAYEKYHKKGLEMVSISLDNQKENWVKAITALNMPWTHLSDLKGWQSIVCDVYKVWAIPDNLLINPQGEIVARNLRGEALHEKLKEIFEGK